MRQVPGCVQSNRQERALSYCKDWAYGSRSLDYFSPHNLKQARRILGAYGGGLRVLDGLIPELGLNRNALDLLPVLIPRQEMLERIRRNSFHI